MKLTEQQLSQLFQDSTRNSYCEVAIGDYLSDCEHNPNLDQAETILNDRTAAQSAALACHFKTWSTQVANDIQLQRIPLTARIIAFCQNLLPSSSMMMPAMAAVFALSAVVFLTAQKLNPADQVSNMVNNDVINSIPFEGRNEQSDRLSKGGFDSDCHLLLAHLVQQNTAWLIAHEDFQLSSNQLAQLNKQRQQLISGKPLAYITGQQVFWDLSLSVNQNTLIPRPDTELIIETALELKQPFHQILDLGTGSGALALVLAREFPDSYVTATDLSTEALEVAQQNAARYQINNIIFIHSDWFSNVNEQNFDLIVSNPPYIEVDDPHLSKLRYEPTTALIASDKGLADLAAIISQSRKHLVSEGILMVEHGYNQHGQVQQLFKQNGYSEIRSHKDLAGIPRITMAHWP